MEEGIPYVDDIFGLLREEMKRFSPPVVSHLQWKRIRQTPFTVLVSCILSLRTKDEVTAEASVRLLKRYDTPEKLSKLSVEEIESLIYPVGFYHTKARRLKEIAKTLVESYDGRVPDSFEELLKLRGVGRKTANIVMTYGHKEEGYLAIDTHCHRIPNRLGWVNTRTPEETERELKKLLPEGYWMEFNHLFVRFGQTICLPVSPKCSVCPIQKYCKRVGVKNHR
ncbi:MAG: endonuclease III [Thermoplasmata archaeon]|nr:MAG: endonuclease III [Thermoplasmata archaeon]RLF25062.1 MAG: endonuclease III [Thermoplasmata archaeon]